MKNLEIENPLLYKELVKTINEKFNRKKLLHKFIFIEVLFYLTMFSSFIMTERCSISEALSAGVFYIISCSCVNVRQLDKKEKSFKVNHTKKKEALEEFKKELEKEKVLVDDNALINSLSTKRFETYTLKDVDIDKKEVYAVNNIFLLDRNDQIKILQEIKKELNLNKKNSNNVTYNLLDEDEAKEVIDRYNISKKLVINKK